MNSRRAAAPAPSRATAFRNPWCGAEIEIFVKLKPSVQGIIQQKLRRNPRSMAGHWRDWDFDLENGTGNQDRKEKQRRCVGKAILEILDQTLGPNHRWSCESDASLKEYTLTHPPDTRKWWGIEIISPPFPADSEWNVTFNQVFDAINRTFDLWTNDLTSCHVHVSPGPYKDSKYTMDQLAQVAKGAFFFESALKGLLPAERRMNRYALPNWSIYSPQQYYSVALHGWAPLFERITRHAYQHGNDTNAFARRMTTMEGSGETTRYASTSFDPFARLGTVEFRRQAGVASAKTAIRRVLLALTLHITALTMNFDNATRDVGRAHPTTEHLIGTLFTTLKTYLPERAYKDAAFKTWLQQCARDYANDSDGEDQFGRMVRRFDEVEINKREANMRAYGVYVGTGTPSRPGSSMSNHSHVPSARRERRASVSGPPPAQSAGRSGIRRSSSRQPEARVPHPAAPAGPTIIIPPAPNGAGRTIIVPGPAPVIPATPSSSRRRRASVTAPAPVIPVVPAPRHHIAAVPVPAPRYPAAPVVPMQPVPVPQVYYPQVPPQQPQPRGPYR